MASIDDVKITDKQNINLQLVYAAGLPKSIHGFTRLNKKGKYIIVLNAAHPESQQAKTFLHECLHIFHGDLEREDMMADQIETIRHKELETILSDLA